MKRPHKLLDIVGFTFLASLLLLPVIASGGIDTETVIASNWVHQLSGTDTNYFLGSVGIGTNNPQSKLHVVGDATVSGAMTIPRQGDVGMGSYTNGVSAEGATPGVLPSGTEGNLLYHNGAQWAALTNLYFDDGTDRLYLGPCTNAAYFDTSAGELHMDGNAIGDLDDPTDAQDAATKNYVDENRMPQRATIWADNITKVSGSGTLSRGVDANQLYNGIAFFSYPADGDSFSASFFLKAGTYNFHVLGRTQPNLGKLDWAVDGTNIENDQDWYSSTWARNVVKTTSSVTITGDGYHKLTGTIDGKNASSSDYYFALTKMWFAPSSDPARE